MPRVDPQDDSIRRWVVQHYHTVDAYMIAVQLGNTTAGRAVCVYIRQYPYTCEAFRLQIDFEATGGTWNWAKALTCHEMGHTVGLVHGNRAYPSVSLTAPVLGCVRTPSSENNRSLSSRGYELINETY